MWSISEFFVRFTNFVLGIIETLLGLRFIFRLFAANSTAPFVNWLYDVTDVLISPFRGIFASPVLEGRSIFDITTLIAMIIYALAFALILYLFDLFSHTDHKRER